MNISKAWSNAFYI